MKIHTVTTCLVSLFLILAAAAGQTINLAGPDSSVEFLLWKDSRGHLQYSVKYRQKPVIETSPIGITVNGIRLAEGVVIGDTERYETDETYCWYGGRSMAVDRSKGARVAISHVESDTRYTLELRSYNDGVAFRHIVPGHNRRVPDEATSFHLPERSTIWLHDLEDHYEAQHRRKSLRSVAPGAWAAPSLTVRLPNGAGYASITEGGLHNYSGMVLRGDGKGAFHTRLGHAVPASYPFRLRYPDDVERLSKPASVERAVATPWRIVIIGSDLNTLANSDILHNVADPPDPKLFPDGIKTPWIKPGRSVWSCLDGGEGTL